MHVCINKGEEGLPVTAARFRKMGGGARDALSDSDSVSEFDFDSEWANLPLCFLSLISCWNPLIMVDLLPFAKNGLVLQKFTIVRWHNNIPPMLMIPTQHQLAKRYSFCEGKLCMNVQNIEFPYNSLEPFQQQSSAVSGIVSL